MSALLPLGLMHCGPARASPFHLLAARWTSHAGLAPIAATPRVAGRTVYVGSWDGYEYAYDEASGRVRWRSYLGLTTGICDGLRITQGVTSEAWVQRGVAYLGGGGSDWYALNARTGRVLWKVFTGDNSLTGGHYNWASPLVYGDHAYVGLASFCDSPLVQGQLMLVDLTSRRVQRTWKVVPNGQVGGTIWTTPVLDRGTNTVFVTTGNGTAPTEHHAQAVVALDATTLAVKSYWALPPRESFPDADWGTSPTLFRDSRNRLLVAAANKSGILYAFRGDRLSAGPVWQRRIARAGVCPTCGDGSVSNGVFDGRRLYFAGGETSIGRRVYQGSIRALNPATGAVLWSVGLPSPVLAALASKDGMIVVADSDGGLLVIKATSGAVLYANRLSGRIDIPGYPAMFAAPTIADGFLFVGTTDGVIHAFGFPPSIRAVPVARRRVWAAR